MYRVCVTIAFLISTVGSSFALAAGEQNDANIAFFESKIRPVLIEHCYSCHAADAKKIQGGLLLDTRAGLTEGGDSGAAVVAGDPGESLLLAALRYESFEMPPQQKLPDAVIADFEKWIQMGAPDPRDGSSGKTKTTINIEEGRQFWSFQPLRQPAVPAVKNLDWSESEIDHFILARLEQAGIEPVADADRRTLIRRVYFALTGLPPRVDDVEQFVADERPFHEVYAELIDRLLDSPHFGERWGRHWLDVARFAESSGGGRSLMFRNAWRYRDYVIDSFNNDKPFDQFIVEQIAGDLLTADSHEERADQIVATGFLVLGPTNYEQQDKHQLRYDVIDEQLDAIGRSFLGMTLGCARCHDHKFDPIPTEDYYAFAGILGSTQTLTPANVSGYVQKPLPVSDEQLAQQAELRSQIDGLTEQIIKMREQLKQLTATDAVADSASETIEAEHNERKQRQAELKSDIEKLSAEKADLQEKHARIRPLAMTVHDVEKPANGHVHVRGVAHNPGPEVPRGFLTVVKNSTDFSAQIPDNQSGRLEMAHWIANAENPLTARVYVNRVWRHLFGAGLVTTTDNFGKTGRLPTHPELLDHLAAQFVENGWSTKQLIRQIMLSHVYRLGVATNEVANKADKQNQLLWRANRRRLDAEVLRDSILTISGQIDLAAGGYTIRKFETYDHEYEYDTVRRSVYVPVFRSSTLELFDAFDFANPNMPVGNRNTSTLPTQSLYLMNSPFMLEQSRHTAEQFLNQNRLTSGPSDDAPRIDLAYQTILGRMPTADEKAGALRYLERFPADDPKVDDRVEAWSSLCHSLMSCLEFLYVE